MEFDPAAGLLGKRGGQVDGLEFTVGENREGHLRVQVFGFTGSAAAVGFAATAATFDKTTRKHIAERAQGTDEAAAEFQFRVGGHVSI
jgi:hypothetical protein